MYMRMRIWRYQKLQIRHERKKMEHCVKIFDLMVDFANSTDFN